MEIWKKQKKISENPNKFAGSDSIILVLYTNRLCDLQIYSQCSNQLKGEALWLSYHLLEFHIP